MPEDPDDPDDPEDDDEDPHDSDEPPYPKEPPYPNEAEVDNEDDDPSEATPEERVDADLIDATGSGTESSPASGADVADRATALDEVEDMNVPDGVISTGDNGTTRSGVAPGSSPTRASTRSAPDEFVAVSPKAPPDDDTPGRPTPEGADAGSRRKSEPASERASGPISNDPMDTGSAAARAVSANGAAGA